MKLQNRNLSFGLQGADVKLLQSELALLGYTLRAGERQEQIFQDDTEAAVRDFQRKRGLKATGIVDPPTARLINKAVDAQPKGELTVKGRVTHEDGSPLAGLEVRAFDRDLRREEPLGKGPALTDNGGAYRITYTADQFSRAGKSGADLLVRAYSPEGAVLGASKPIFNARQGEVVDLVVAARALPVLSEYEQLIADLAPLLQDVALDALSDTDLAFLDQETGADPKQLRMLAAAARLKTATAIPAEAFYGWGRQGLAQDPDSLLTQDTKELRRSLIAAIDAQIVPARLAQAVDDILTRLQALGIAHTFQGAPTREFIGRLIAQGDAHPLAGSRVQAVVRLAGKPADLGEDLSDPQGRFSFAYPTRATADGQTEPRQISLRILDSAGAPVHQTDVKLQPDVPDPVQIPVPLPAQPPEPTLTELAAAVNLNLPGALVDALARLNIRTLTDVRRSGGLNRLKNLPVAVDDPALVALQAHADLNVLAADPPTRARLIEHGYTSAAGVAAAGRTEFVARMSGSLGHFRAFQFHTAASAQARFTDNLITDVEVARANGRPGLINVPALDAAAPRRCGCADCQAAVSPLAYLADLLDYAIGHLWDRGAVDLNALTNRFYQPFGRLPAACDALDAEVRQVRLCIEVLRGYLVDNPPLQAAGAVLQSAERQYRHQAYFQLLGRMGTSFDELAAARPADGETRRRLADRIGIRPNRLDVFFLDPTAAVDVITYAALENLFGLIAVDAARDPLAPAGQPRIEALRLERMQDLWLLEDRPADLPPDGQPLIDPDVIGPDDFRNPRPKTNAADPDRAFDLWLRRRQRVDGLLNSLVDPAQLPQRNVRGQQVTDYITGMFTAMYAQVPGLANPPWRNTQPVDFTPLADTLAHGDTAAVEAARQTLADDLALDVDSFARLLEIREKDRLWTAHPAHAAVTADEWREAAAILVQAVKRRLFPQWRNEEQQARIDFGPREFWFSAREPEPGEWPPRISAPLIDPERVGPDDLPEPEIGGRAIGLWQQRRGELDRISRRLRTLRQTQGLQAALGQALGDPNDPANPNALPHDFDDLLTRLNDPAPAVAAVAAGQVDNDLHMTTEGFIRIMEIRAKDTAARAPNPPDPPTESEWAEVTAILTTAEKVERRYGPWTDEEQRPPAPATPLAYWQALKARLPRWLAGAGRRTAWREALEIRYRRPLIDPDVIGPGDLADPRPGQSTYDLWRARDNALNNRQAALRQARLNAADPLAGLDAICRQALGHPSQVLVDIQMQQDTGNDQTVRLAQFNLTRREFALLLRVRGLVDGGNPVPESHWRDVEAALTLVGKRRGTALWRQQEAQAGIVLNPDQFVLPAETPAAFTDPQPGSRKEPPARRDWQELLSARADQRQNVIQGIHRMVAETEAEILPGLRDALILATDPPGAAGTDLEARGKRLTDLLLIDTRVDGCQVTTRISQAISTIQGLLGSVRTGQLRDTYPDLQLRDDYFDERWRWIGSYATWRAAVFVHIYPENILAPALHRPMTYGFETFLDQVRQQRRRINPDNACDIAGIYRDYYLDVVGLKIEASCHAQPNLSSGTCRTRVQGGTPILTYWFGRSPISGRCYWSHDDPADTTGAGRSLWAPIPELENVKALRGAVPFRAGDGQAFILLFAVVHSEGADKLVLVRYRLSVPGWEGVLHELEWPDDEADECIVAVNQARSMADPGHLPLLAIQAVKDNGSVLYERSIHPDGDQWDGEWIELISPAYGWRLKAMAPVYSNNIRPYYIFLQSGANGILSYRIFGDARYPQTHYFANGPAVWLGVIPWPIQDQVFVLWITGRNVTETSGGRVSAQRLQPPQRLPLQPVGDFLDAPGRGALNSRYDAAEIPPIIDLFGFNAWMQQAAEIDLSDFPISIVSGPLSGAANLFDFLTLPADSAFRRNNNDGFYRSMATLEFSRLENFLAGASVAVAVTGTMPANLQAWQRADDLVLENSAPRLNTAACLRRLFNNRFATQPDPLQMRGLTQTAAFSTPALNNIEALAVDSGIPTGSLNGVTIGYHHHRQGAVRSRFVVDPATRQLVAGDLVRISPHHRPNSVPRLNGAWPGASMAGRRGAVRNLYRDHIGGPGSNLVYLEEFFYLVPVQIAMELQRNGHYVAALDWLRTVYDYTEQGDDRKVWYGLIHEASLANTFTRSADWLLDPLNPHAIAKSRANTYTRYTLLTLIRCFLSYADAEFTRDTAESIENARTLYLTALELLNDDPLRQTDACQDLIGTIDVRLSDASWRPVVEAVLAGMPGAAGSLPQMQALGQQVQAALNTGEADEVRVTAVRDLVNQALAARPADPTFDDLNKNRVGRRAAIQTALLADDGVAATVGEVGRLASSDSLQAVAQVSGVSTAVLLNGGGQVDFLANVPAGNGQGGALQPFQVSLNRLFQTLRVGVQYDPGFAYQFCIPPNPVVTALKLSAALNLYKLRHCRDIAGQQRQVEPYAAATDTTTGLPTIGAGGQLVLPGAITLQPTPYRYETLIARSRELVQLAAQIEASMLAAIEKRDAELYSQLRARQDLRLTRAGVRLQDLRVREAEGSVRLAELQQERARFQAEHFQQLLDDGYLLQETLSLVLMASTAVVFTGAAIAALTKSFGLDQSQFLGFSAQALQTTASSLSQWASYERRRQEWEFQRDLSQLDIGISHQQVTIAQDRVQVVGQERRIAQLQADHAGQTAEFLSNKFTNAELYDWMSDVLEGVYAFFLQQATATAKLALAQLAFERQEVPPPLISDDYWEAPGPGVLSSEGESGVDRRGLTGSARLLQDIHQLDQFAFETRKRKLELSRTISLAQMAPAEFQRFRETGMIAFATPMALFDRDFPGHYLRQVKGVRLSVIALIPPVQGIRATLTSGRLSRIVVGGELYQTVRVQRGPDQIALTTAQNASGILELQPGSDLLRPFEGIGVDTNWELRLPKASNPFDFSTIADVLMTIDYTALNSFDYRDQVIRAMPSNISGDQPFSFRHQFADQWYDLHNPQLTATPMTVRFATRREDFPPNLENLRIQHVVLYFARAGGAYEIPVNHLLFTEQGATGAIGGGAISVDGTISTRRGNAGAWTPMTGKSPAGRWELSLPNSTEMKNRFQEEEIDDILLVITYSGRTPQWSA